MKKTERRRHGAWWRADEGDVGGSIVKRVEAIRRDASTARGMRLVHMGMYGGINKNGDPLGGPLGFYSLSGFGMDAKRVRFNLAAACIDTAASRVGSLKPQPRIQTNDADYSTYLRAKKLSHALEGQFHDLRVHKLMRRCFYDAASADIGIVYGFLDEDGNPALERVLPMELFVDENECANGGGTPKRLYRYHLIDRESLIDKFPKHEDDIAAAPGPSQDDRTEFFLTYDGGADQVVVIEAWHIGSPSRHTITLLNGNVLSDEEGDWDEFPFAFYRWKESQVGFHGVSICEEVAMAQHTINEHIKRVQALQRLGSNAYILINENSNVKPQQITNLPLQLLRYRGTPPVWNTVTATPPDLQNEVDRITNQVMMQLGLSPGGMQGTRAPGVTSGIAIQTLDDLQSQRHVINARLFEDFGIDIARLLIRLNDAAAEQNPEHTLSGSTRRGRGTYSRLRWADIRLNIDDDVRITCQPISALPSTPTGRTEMIEKWLSMGAISMTEAVAQLDFPDTGEFIRRALVDFDYASMQVERVIDGDLDVDPVPYQNLSVAAQVFRTERLFAEMDGAPREVLDSLEIFLEKINDEIEASAPPPMESPVDGGISGVEPTVAA